MFSKSLGAKWQGLHLHQGCLVGLRGEAPGLLASGPDVSFDSVLVENVGLLFHGVRSVSSAASVG